MATAAEARVRDRIFIGGEWVEPRGTETLDVVNPATEEVVGTIPLCDPDDVDRAVRAAGEAFEGWALTRREERASFLEAIAGGLNERADEIAATIAEELGMPLKLSRIIQT